MKGSTEGAAGALLCPVPLSAGTKGTGLYPPCVSVVGHCLSLGLVAPCPANPSCEESLHALSKIVLCVECVSPGKKGPETSSGAFKTHVNVWGTFLPLCPLLPVHSKWSADKRCSLCSNNLSQWLSPAVLGVRQSSWRGGRGCLRAGRKKRWPWISHPPPGKGVEGAECCVQLLLHLCVLHQGRLSNLVFSWVMHSDGSSHPREHGRSFGAWLSGKSSPLVAAGLSFYHLYLLPGRELFSSSPASPAALTIFDMTAASI